MVTSILYFHIQIYIWHAYNAFFTIHKIDEIAQLNYHTLSVGLILQQLGCDRNLGLNSQKANYRLQQNGKNVVSPPKNKIIYKILGYLFGGFCGLLWFAAIITILSYKPLGEPNPSPLNLALGIVIVRISILF